MNILLEIADRDLVIIALALLAVCILGIIIFYIANKDSKEKYITEEEVEEKETIELTEEQKQAKAELERVFNQMSADLENKNPEPEEIEEFERQQEENAIISYQELIRQAAAKQKEPINSIIQKEEKPLEISNEVVDEPKKFKNSEIISPIFGIQNSGSTPKVEYQKKQEEPIMAKHAYDEIKKSYDDENNRDFLNSLKEFRKNL